MRHRVLYELPEPARRQLESLRKKTAEHDAEVSAINFPNIEVQRERTRSSSHNGHIKQVDAPRQFSDGTGNNEARSRSSASVDSRWDRVSSDFMDSRESLPSLPGTTKARGSCNRPKSTRPARRLSRQTSRSSVDKKNPLSAQVDTPL